MARGMSERRRAFLGLQGHRFPRIGQKGWWSGPRSELSRRSPRAVVEVIRLSSSGKTVWTRFVSEYSRRRFGLGKESHRWWLLGGDEHNVAYCAFGNSLYGTVYFG